MQSCQACGRRFVVPTSRSTCDARCRSKLQRLRRQRAVAEALDAIALALEQARAALQAGRR